MRNCKYDISFIIPVYNSKPFLNRCMDSIISQEGFSKEIIVVDDGSVDGSMEILRKYQKMNPDIQLLNQKHQGASVARNKGIDMAKGFWICFVDSDDYLEAGCMKEILKASSDTCDVIFTDYAKDRFNKIKKFSHASSDKAFGKSDFESFQRAVLNKNHIPENLQVITPWAKLYRTDFLKKNNLRFTPGIRKSQDLLFNFEVYQMAACGRYIKFPMYYYRYNAESLCNKFLPGVLEDYLKQSEKIKMLLIKDGRFEKFKEDYYVRCTVNYMFSLRLDYAHHDNMTAYRDKKRKFQASLKIDSVKDAIEHVDAKQFSFKERILLEMIRVRQFGIICLLNHGYGLIESMR